MHALPYGSDLNSHTSKRLHQEPPEKPSIKYDDYRHGAYVPSHLKNESSPVKFSRSIAPTYVEPLMPAPTQPAALPLPGPPGLPAPQRNTVAPTQTQPRGEGPRHPARQAQNVKLANKGQKPRIG